MFGGFINDGDGVRGLRSRRVAWARRGSRTTPGVFELGVASAALIVTIRGVSHAIPAFLTPGEVPQETTPTIIALPSEHRPLPRGVASGAGILGNALGSKTLRQMALEASPLPESQSQKQVASQGY